MASKTSVCGICYLRQITKPSDVWCSECEEGLCLECKEHHDLSKASRTHSTLPISQYEKLPTSVLEISHLCSEHSEKFQFYCKMHDRPCCSSCIVSDHQKCQDLIQLNDMIRNVKKSYGIHDIEQFIIDMIENIERIKKDRQINLSSLKEDRKIIENEIEQTRIKINAQLDDLQKTIMKELYEAESIESKVIGELLEIIEKNENEIKEYHENLINIKQHASDFQTFLAMKHIERDVAEKDNYVTSLVKSNKLNRVTLSCKINDALINNLNEFRTLGEIIVSTRSSEVVIIRKKATQAQIVVADVQFKSIENLSVVLQSTVNTKLDDIRGCTLLPDGRMVFSCYTQNCVSGFNRDGSKDFCISLEPTHGFDITYIHENNTIAVTSGGDVNRCIRIIDVDSRNVKETFSVEWNSYGIVSRNNKLICRSVRNLWAINLADKAVINIAATEIKFSHVWWVDTLKFILKKNNLFGYVSSLGNKLYYTNSDIDTVICCDLHGTTQWQFKDLSVLIEPRGISVDNDGNVYVAGNWSNNVVVISPDGQRHRVLLSEKDCLSTPHALYYDRNSNQLLVANEIEKAFLFRLE